MPANRLPSRRSPVTRRPTIRDVADAARVATATVSAILNRRPHCYASAATRQRVIEAARRIGYRPSTLARALNGIPTATLGLIVPNLVTEMTTRKMAGFVRAARVGGFMTITAANEGDPAAEDESIRWLLDRAVDGIVLYPAPHGPHLELQRLVADRFPLVTLDGAPMELACADVSVDSVAAGRLQIEHLLSLGRRRIALVDTAGRCWLNDQKLAGMTGALEDAGLEAAGRLTLDLGLDSDAPWTEQVCRQARSFFESHRNRIDAVATIGDTIALACLRFLAEVGVRVPEDVAVIGHDGLQAAELGQLPLSTVMHDSEQIGALAYQMLARSIADPGRSTPRREVIKPRLIPRQSTLGRTGVR